MRLITVKYFGHAAHDAVKYMTVNASIPSENVRWHSVARNHLSMWQNPYGKFNQHEVITVISLQA